MTFGIVFTNGCKFSINKQGLKKCVQKGLKKCYYSIYVPDHVGTLAQVGNSPNLGWPNKELGGSQPI